MAPLLDSFGRVHDNLRISVTDRCNIRCFYCMPETGVQFVERHEILDFEEIERFVRIAVTLILRLVVPLCLTLAYRPGGNHPAYCPLGFPAGICGMSGAAGPCVSRRKSLFGP